MYHQQGTEKKYRDWLVNQKYWYIISLTIIDFFGGIIAEEGNITVIPSNYI